MIFGALRILPAFQGPLFDCISKSSNIDTSFGSLEAGQGDRKSGKERNVLLSIRYGIPKTTIILKPAMRIIGFFSILIGETVAHR
jgi:hypothetical protein